MNVSSEKSAAPVSSPASVSVWDARPEVYAQLENHIGFIALNRPKALNALSLGMVRLIKAAMDAWRDDPSVHAVVIYSPHAKALCAGGDIRALYEAHHAGEHAAIDAFFTEEYRLNHLIFTYPKPYIALMNGVVVGGGMGISQGAAHTGGLRIVGAGARLAMPETKIGLFPDVGISWFLARTPKHLGTYIGLSGNMIHAGDALHAGLADLSLPDHAFEGIVAGLRATAFSSGAEVVAHMRAAVAEANRDHPAPASALAEHEAAIAEHFSHDTVPAILASLAARGDDAWAQGVLAELRQRSPLSMAVSLALIRRAAGMSMAQCLRTDLDLTRTVFAQGDILEGIRAVIVDKDHAPRWRHASAEAVDPQRVESMFTSAWTAADHPLASLRDA